LKAFRLFILIIEKKLKLRFFHKNIFHRNNFAQLASWKFLYNGNAQTNYFSLLEMKIQNIYLFFDCISEIKKPLQH